MPFWRIKNQNLFAFGFVENKTIKTKSTAANKMYNI